MAEQDWGIAAPVRLLDVDRAGVIYNSTLVRSSIKRDRKEHIMQNHAYACVALELAASGSEAWLDPDLLSPRPYTSLCNWTDSTRPQKFWAPI